jgi:hypothetical protein
LEEGTKPSLEQSAFSPQGGLEVLVKWALLGILFKISHH